jgi:hypothetical protein
VGLGLGLGLAGFKARRTRERELIDRLAACRVDDSGVGNTKVSRGGIRVVFRLFISIVLVHSWESGSFRKYPSHISHPIAHIP